MVSIKEVAIFLLSLFIYLVAMVELFINWDNDEGFLEKILISAISFAFVFLAVFIFAPDVF